MQKFQNYSVGNGFATANILRALTRAKDVAKKQRQATAVKLNGKPFAVVMPNGTVLKTN